MGRNRRRQKTLFPKGRKIRVTNPENEFSLTAYRLHKKEKALKNLRPHLKRNDEKHKLFSTGFFAFLPFKNTENKQQTSFNHQYRVVKPKKRQNSSAVQLQKKISSIPQ
ncbi:hypothetical protein [Desulfobotulus sp.]|jgi:hypothetical protein|uniref:hypothetical protein n=1 Tax=Desulfobotulus sp. TaxID=1940337 RepID=UPI002A36E1B9|nr:hypothetical protein [Desulfobotulus sp.]MDY0163292.1 hypothetical protein [Desulfobotulus sp.]